MLDLKALQNDFESISEKLRRKKVDEALLERLRESFVKLKQERQKLEKLQAEQNAKSRLFPVYKKEGKDIAALKMELDENKQKIAVLQEVVRTLENSCSEIALSIPNIPDDDVPLGEDESQNVVLETVGEIPRFSFTPKEHWELAENCGWIDFERGVKLAKSRFSVLRKEGARIERALIDYMLDFNRARGFEEVCVPYLVNRETLVGTGQLPKFEEDLFKIEGEDLFLIPTAEVPVTNLFRDEILPAEALPQKLTSYTACFRKETSKRTKR